MRVLHVIPSLSLTSGGPSLALPAMARALQSHGVSVDVATTDDDGRGLRKKDVPLGKAIVCDGFRVIYFKKQTEFYKVSLPLRAWLREHVKDYDLVHIHALFSFASIIAARAARKHRVPYIIRPLGVLNAYGLEQRRRWLKRLSFRLIEKPLLDGAAAVHYTSTQERDEAARLKIKAPSHVIPLGIDLTPFQQLPDAEVFFERFAETRGQQIVLFLSRLDPKKGIELLLQAFAQLRSSNQNTRLVIAGDGSREYVEALKRTASQLALTHQITWTGQLEGTVKLAAFAAASIFVLPSHSENFGIALLEAMAAGVACISSDQVALGIDAAREEAVLLVPRNADAVANALQSLLADTARRSALAKKAAALARDSYSEQAMSACLLALYQTIALPS